MITRSWYPFVYCSGLIKDGMLLMMGFSRCTFFCCNMGVETLRATSGGLHITNRQYEASNIYKLSSKKFQPQFPALAYLDFRTVVSARPPRVTDYLCRRQWVRGCGFVVEYTLSNIYVTDMFYYYQPYLNILLIVVVVPVEYRKALYGGIIYTFSSSFL